MPLGEKDVGKGAPVGKRIQSGLVLMNSGRLRVAANTLLFSDSILAFATDQLSKYTAVTTSARRKARRAARNRWSECSSGVFLGGRLGIVLVSLWGAAIALLLLRDAPGSLSGTRTLGRRE